MSVSHCVAAPHMSRGAPQLCPTYKGLEIVPISKNTTQKLFFFPYTLVATRYLLLWERRYLHTPADLAAMALSKIK